MTRLLQLLPLALLPACASLQPPPPPAPPQAEYVTPENMRTASDWFGYSQAVRVGPWITVSAVPGFDIEKRGFPERYPEQVAKAFENLAVILAAAGATMNDVTEITTYQLDMGRFNDTVDAKSAAFGEHRPAWTALGVAGLPMSSMQFQVSARAYAPAGRVATSSAAAPTVEAPPQPAEKKEKSPPRFMNRPGY
jgi:enamine deaminase RidA (YjgF/YER057c/UK114 family)